MSPNHPFHRQTGDGFLECRRIFADPYTPAEPNFEEPQPEMQAETDSSRAPDVVTILDDPESAGSLRDEQLPTTFDQLWSASNQNVFDKQRAETANRQAKLQARPDLKEVPQFAAVEQLQSLSAENAGNLTDISLQQTAYYESLYGETSLSDLPDAEVQTPVTEKIARVPIDGQLTKIKTVTDMHGIPSQESDWADMKTTLEKGGTVVADIQGTPVVCGAGTGADVSSDIYMLSQKGNGLLPHGGEGGDGKGAGTDGEGAKLSKAESDSATDKHEETEEKSYSGSNSRDLEGGFKSVEFQTPSVKINVASEHDEHFTERSKMAVLAASSVPLHPPAQERLTEKGKEGTRLGNYTAAERKLIAGLSQNEGVRKILPRMGDFQEDAEGIRDLLAMRFTPATQNILTLDDDYRRPREFFHAIGRALELDENSELRSIAEQNFKRQLLSMQPRSEEEEEFEKHVPSLDMMKSLEDPKMMLDLVSAHLKRELPLYACREQIQVLRSENANEAGLSKK